MELPDEKIERIIQSVLKRNAHTEMSPETRQLFFSLESKLDEHIRQHNVDTQKINDKLDPDSDHFILKDVVPVIEAFKGSKVLGEALKWLAGLGTAYLIIKSFLK